MLQKILEQSTFCGYVIEYEFQNRIYTLRRNFIHHPSIQNSLFCEQKTIYIINSGKFFSSPISLFSTHTIQFFLWFNDTKNISTPIIMYSRQEHDIYIWGIYFLNKQVNLFLNKRRSIYIWGDRLLNISSQFV